MLSSLNGSGKSQSLRDRANSAKYTVAGDNLARVIYKATTEEIKAPKAKHVDYLVASSNDPNISIPQTAHLLIKRSRHKNWVVVFKSLLTFHQIMIKGSERFMQYNSTNGVLFALLNFSDNTNTLAYEMSIPIRDYSNYLNEKILSYRSLSFDLTRIPRGKDSGILRHMSPEKLLTVLPVASKLMDALLKSQFKSSQVFNGVINAAFKILHLEAIRLYASYNDGIIKMLELFFDMDKSNCKKSLDLYKNFLHHSEQMTFVIKNAAEVGLDTRDVPELIKAPASIYESLVAHYESIESHASYGSNKKKITGQVQPIVSLKNINTGNKSVVAGQTTGKVYKDDSENYSNISEVMKKKLIEEEEQHLQHLKKKKVPTATLR